MRPSRPWFRVSKNAWYAEVNGCQRSLGQHPHGAPKPKKSEKTGLWNPPKSIRDALDAILKGDLPVPEAQMLTVQVVCDDFLKFSSSHNDPKAFAHYEKYLQSLCDHCGMLHADDITPAHVIEWLNAHPTWKGSRRHAIIAAKRAFNFAVEQRRLFPSPLKGLKNTRAVSRARFLTSDQRAKVLAAIHDEHFRNFVEDRCVLPGTNVCREAGSNRIDMHSPHQANRRSEGERIE